MKQINVYSFDELSDEAKEYAHDKEGYMENPWADEAWDSWRSFARDVFPDVIADWSYGDRSTHVSFTHNSCCDINGYKLFNVLYDLLDKLPEYPTGYCADDYCYGYARDHLLDILDDDSLTAKEFARDVFAHFCNKMDAEEEYCQTMEYYADHAMANNWYYTKDGERVDI